MQNFPPMQDKTKKSKRQKKIALTSVGRHSVDLTFNAPSISSDGGLLLIREIETRLGLLKQLSTCLTDPRDSRYTHHSLLNLLSQRVYQIIAGYEDGNDSNELKTDSILKLCLGSLPQSGKNLASQPTISRFENGVSRTDLYRLSIGLGEIFIASYDQAPPIIILDCDDTNANTYGQQEQTEYNHYYGEHCYMPFHLYEGLSGKLITTVLKPGRRSKAANVFAIVKRVIQFIQFHWSETLIILRGDSHFCSPHFMEWSDNQDNVHFLTGLSTNKRLKKIIEVTQKGAEKSYQRTKIPVKTYHSFEYKADSWHATQRIIAKIEVNEKGTNIRYICTDLRQYRAKGLYEKAYAARGEMELFIKDHKTYLKSHRMSCTKFEANYFRLFLHSIAYVFLHTLQQQVLVGTAFENATKQTIQLKIIKVAAIVTEGKNNIGIAFTKSNPRNPIYVKVFEIFEILATKFSGP